MSFNLSNSTTPSQPAVRPLYPSFNLQTPATPTPTNPLAAGGQQHLKPPQRPASVPLSFGGLSHSASTPSLSQAFQNQAPQPQQPQQQNTLSGQGQTFGGLGAQQPFSPAPQPPLTTYDLSNSPFQKPQQPQWGGQLGGQTLTRSHSQQFMPLNQNPLGERRYLPSHLRSYSPERSSPLAKDTSAPGREGPSPKEKRRVSFGSVTTFGHPSTSNFGGSGFGTPKDDGKIKSKREEDDLPPSASIYDFTRSPYTKEAPRSPSPPPDITPSLFTSSSVSSSPSKRPDPTPVILFGFPSSHAPLIIREYEKYGPILEHFSSTSHPLLPSQGQQLPPQEILQGGNWVRLTYADPVSAARAVATNGSLIGGAYMIGVIYAPKPTNNNTTVQNTGTEATGEGMDVDAPSSRRRDERQGGERKMNVVKGQSMFVRKEIRNENVGWGQYLWNVLGVDQKKTTTAPGGGANLGGAGMGTVGGGQSNIVVRALKGLSESVFGF